MKTPENPLACERSLERRVSPRLRPAVTTIKMTHPDGTWMVRGYYTIQQLVGRHWFFVSEGHPWYWETAAERDAKLREMEGANGCKLSDGGWPESASPAGPALQPADVRSSAGLGAGSVTASAAGGTDADLPEDELRRTKSKLPPNGKQEIASSGRGMMGASGQPALGGRVGRKGAGDGRGRGQRAGTGESATGVAS